MGGRDSPMPDGMDNIFATSTSPIPITQPGTVGMRRSVSGNSLRDKCSSPGSSGSGRSGGGSSQLLNSGPGSSGLGLELLAAGGVRPTAVTASGRIEFKLGPAAASLMTASSDGQLEPPPAARPGARSSRN